MVALLKAAEPRLATRHRLDLARRPQPATTTTTSRRVTVASPTRAVRDYIIDRRLWRTPTRRELSDAVGAAAAEAPAKKP